MKKGRQGFDGKKTGKPDLRLQIFFKCRMKSHDHRVLTIRLAFEITSESDEAKTDQHHVHGLGQRTANRGAAVNDSRRCTHTKNQD